MDFAKKQLEKYGWTNGKGLGKNENGISEPLKPKIKRSVTGVGHDPAAEFNEHWWTALYDKAAGNVEVEEKNGKTKKIKTKDENGVVITTSTWKLKQKPKDEENKEQYSDYFVRTAVLTGGGNKVEKVRESESEGEEMENKKDVIKMTDEELFAVCEGRTAHKGARHGLKATGKLARIAQQEAMLLRESRFSDYSHAKKLKQQVVEEMNLNSDSESNVCKKKKKKKRKRCNSNEKLTETVTIDTLAESIKPLPADSEMVVDDNVANPIAQHEEITKKSKKSKRKQLVNMEIIEEETNNSPTPKKKKKLTDEVLDQMDVNNSDDITVSETYSTKKKKKKSKKRDM